MQKKLRWAGWNYSWMTLGFNCIIFRLYYPNVLLKFFSCFPSSSCPSVWEPVPVGSWLFLRALPLPHFLSVHTSLCTEQLLGSGFPCSSNMRGSRAGGSQGAGRGHNLDSWSQLTTRVSHHTQHIKLGKEHGTFGLMVFVFHCHHYKWWSLALLEMAEHLPAFGRWWMDSLFCFACMPGSCFSY